ncbi:PQQ-binding-like beta-propeller repeat protein [Streptomyces zhihengii]
MYAANRFQQVCAVDGATGRELWRRSTQAPAWRETPVTALSPSGRTVLTGDAVQLTAFAARDGRRLWKFQEAGADDAPEQAAPRYAAFPAGARTVVRRGRTFYSSPWTDRPPPRPRSHRAAKPADPGPRTRRGAGPPDARSKKPGATEHRATGPRRHGVVQARGRTAGTCRRG